MRAINRIRPTLPLARFIADSSQFLKGRILAFGFPPFVSRSARAVRVNLARTSGALSAVDSVRICCVKFEFLEGRFTTPLRAKRSRYFVMPTIRLSRTNARGRKRPVGLSTDDSGVIAPTIPEISRPPIPELFRPPVPRLCRPPIPELIRPPVEAA
jgi:hypothetical protein